MLIVDKLTSHRPFKPWAFATYSFLMGFYSYVIYALLLDALRFAGGPVSTVSFILALTDGSASLDLFEIIVVSGLAVPVGLGVAAGINHNVLHRVARLIWVSRKFGDLDVWNYIMNSNVPPWVVIRDREYDLMFDGWIEAFSEGTEKSELFLRDVKIFGSSSK